MQAICPKCSRAVPALSGDGQGAHACECGHTIPFTHGIYQFVPADSFYEGKFTDARSERTTLRARVAHGIRLVSIEGGEDRMWRRSVRYITRRHGGRERQVLNLGAGGGHAFLAKLGRVTAVDLSLASLLRCRRMYEHCYQADAARLPFPDASFDLVFSSHLLGHIPLEQKQDVIREMRRVTRPGGFSLHSAECEADNVVYRRAKRYPDLYRKCFEDVYGHHGLELPSAYMERFRRESFEPVYEFPDYCKGLVRPASSYKTLFGNEYAQHERLFRVLAGLSRLLSCHRVVTVASGLLLFPFTLLNRLCGPDGVDSVKLLYRKPCEDGCPD